jgi:hypothetical protein
LPLVKNAKQYNKNVEGRVRSVGLCVDDVTKDLSGVSESITSVLHSYYENDIEVYLFKDKLEERPEFLQYDLIQVPQTLIVDKQGKILFLGINPQHVNSLVSLHLNL